MNNDKENDHGPSPAGQPPPYSPPQAGFEGGYAIAGYPVTDTTAWPSSPPAYNDAFTKLPSGAIGGLPIEYRAEQDVRTLQHHHLQQQTIIIQQPGAMAWVAQPGPLNDPPNDYMSYSIFVTLCCCWLVGIFAIARSSECRAAIAAGDRVTAEVKSREALSKAHLALGLGLASCILVGIILGVYYGMLAGRYHY